LQQLLPNNQPIGSLVNAYGMAVTTKQTNSPEHYACNNRSRHAAEASSVLSKMSRSNKNNIIFDAAPSKQVVAWNYSMDPLSCQKRCPTTVNLWL